MLVRCALLVSFELLWSPGSASSAQWWPGQASMKDAAADAAGIATALALAVALEASRPAWLAHTPARKEGLAV